MPPAATEVKTVTFYSRSPNLRIVRRSALTQFTADRREVPWKPEVVYEFEQRLLPLEPGVDVLPDGPDGEEQDAIGFLRNHFNRNGLTAGGFYEDGDEPGKLHPTEDEMLGRLMDAVSVLERDDAVAVLEEEQATHGRAIVTATAEKAIERIDQANAALALEADEQAHPPPPPGAPPQGG